MPSRFSSVLLMICFAPFALAQPATAPATSPAPQTPTPQSVEELDRARAADADYLTRQDEDGLTVLHRAAKRGDAAVVRRILELGGDAGARSGNATGLGVRGATPMHAAMIGALLDGMIRSMAPHDQSKDQLVTTPRERERKTRGQPDPARGPMQFAEVTRLLLAHGADANAAAEDGSMPLHVAAQTGNAELVSLLIAAKADVNAVHRPRGLLETAPLVYAAGCEDVNTVRALLDAGADPAKVPAAARGYFANRAMSDIAIFRLLLDRGLELPPNALKIATRNNRVEAAAEIIRRGKAGDQDAALYAAVRSSRQNELKPEDEGRLVQTVKILLDAGASPSAPGGTGEALVAAVARGHAGVVKLLKERGAKVDWSRLKDDEHHPLKIAYSAALENRIDRLKEFEALGMPLDALGASMLGRADRLRDLITTGKATVAGEAGSTALYFAAAFGQADCVALLLDAKTDPNARLPSWDTPDIGPRPLEGAAIGGHVAVARLLLERGADPALLKLDDQEWAKLSPEIRDLLRPPRRP